jgi:Ca2+-binding EF-hand superfamily protein
MATPTIAQDRLEQRFKLWDTNGDGVIDRSDFEAEAQQIVRAFGEDENTPRAAQVVTAFRQMWDFLAGKIGTTSLSLEQFKQVSLDQIISQGDAGFARVLRPTIQAIVTLCDIDGDGRIDPREFGNWLRAIGADPSRAAELFRRVDADGDGYLSVDELVRAVQAYHEGTLDVSLLGGV